LAVSEPVAIFAVVGISALMIHHPNPFCQEMYDLSLKHESLIHFFNQSLPSTREFQAMDPEGKLGRHQH